MPSALLKLRVTFFLTLLCTSAQRASGQNQRLVFAHYMLANFDYISADASNEEIVASYEREIRQAQSIGIDGFALNAGGWLREPRYIRRASAMFEAATRLHSGFKLFFSVDMCCGNDAADIADMMRRFASNPRYTTTYFRYDGKAVLSTFSGSDRGPDFWHQVLHDLEQGSHPSTSLVPMALDVASGVPSSAPLRVFFIPAFFWGGELPNASAIKSHLSAYKSLIDGAFYWGIAGVPGLGYAPDQLSSSHAFAATLHAAGKIYMAPICFQFWGANHGRYYEYSGYSGMRSMWRDAIDVTHPEWVEIITWNDFVEGTYISPIDDPARYVRANDLDESLAPASTLHFFHSHRGATDLLAYFIAWYKMGREPAIRKDAIYWAYRTQPLTTKASRTVPIQLHGHVSDVLYVTANLTAPATLRVSFGEQSSSIAVAAGSTDIQLPFATGHIPHIELLRNGLLLASADGEDIISPDPAYADFYYSTGSMRTSDAAPQ
jgi:glucan endo-1,3-alpha-glucosidase